MRRTSLALCSPLLAVALLSGCCCGTEPEEGSAETGGNPLRRELRLVTLMEAPVEGNQPPLFGRPQPLLRDVLDAIDDARTDSHVVGVFLRVGPMGGAYGRIGDLAESLGRVRAAGKPVHCHFETIDNSGYQLLASSCDRISVTPAGMLDTVGIAAQVFYARSLLDSIGVSADLLQVGDFKGAAEPFTRDDMSPETRETLGALVDDLHAGLVAAIVEGRHVDAERAQAILDAGPYDAAGAREAGLVDGVEYDDEAILHAREACGATRNSEAELLPEQHAPTLSEILDALSGVPPETADEGPRIVVAYLDGEIDDAEEESLGTGHAGPFVEGMRELADDDDVRAVVLRIDSPGGSALGSDRMWHAVRRIAERKPVIVSVGDMAASGGYYIAAAGTEIIAHPGSIVGSIGVVGGKVSAAGMLERIGVHSETLSRGRHASWSTLTQPFTEDERVVLERMMRSTYERFAWVVGEGRHLDRQQVEAVAQGRIWSGADALENHLIDRFGGLSTAIDRAREASGAGAEVAITEWPRRRTVIELLSESMGGQEQPSARAMLERELPMPATHLLGLARSLSGGEHVLVQLPVVIDIH